MLPFQILCIASVLLIFSVAEQLDTTKSAAPPHTPRPLMSMDRNAFRMSFGKKRTAQSPMSPLDRNVFRMSLGKRAPAIKPSWYDAIKKEQEDDARQRNGHQQNNNSPSLKMKMDRIMEPQWRQKLFNKSLDRWYFGRKR